VALVAAPVALVAAPVALVAALVVGAVKGAEFLAEHSAMGEVEKAQEKRRKRKQQGQP
jgi:hypothetical protein